MCAKKNGCPVGNLRLGRRFTEAERNDPVFLGIVANLPMCASDHSLLIRFGGECEECGKVWGLLDLRTPIG